MLRFRRIAFIGLIVVLLAWEWLVLSLFFFAINDPLVLTNIQLLEFGAASVGPILFVIFGWMITKNRHRVSETR
jgi:hypothetical protein